MLLLTATVIRGDVTMDQMQDDFDFEAHFAKNVVDIAYFQVDAPKPNQCYHTAWRTIIELLSKRVLCV
jgi:hypothetical protein